MTLNPLERAVIEAARSLVRSVPELGTELFMPSAAPLVAAVKALDAPREVQEIGWHEIAEGDELRSAKNGRLYPVLSVLKLAGRRYRITLRTGKKRTSIERPTPEEPTAHVRRGPAGRAVETFVHVFTSGEA